MLGNKPINLQIKKINKMAINYLTCSENDANLVYTCDPCETVEGVVFVHLCLLKKALLLKFL